MGNETAVIELNMHKHFNLRIFNVVPGLEYLRQCNRHIVTPTRNSAKNVLALNALKVHMHGKVLQTPEQSLLLGQMIRLNHLIRWKDFMLQLHVKTGLAKKVKAGTPSRR